MYFEGFKMLYLFTNAWGIKVPLTGAELSAISSDHVLRLIVSQNYRGNSILSFESTSG